MTFMVGGLRVRPELTFWLGLTGPPGAVGEMDFVHRRHIWSHPITLATSPWTELSTSVGVDATLRISSVTCHPLLWGYFHM